MNVKGMHKMKEFIFKNKQEDYVSLLCKYIFIVSIWWNNKSSWNFETKDYKGSYGSFIKSLG
jgi:hypothetical protein